MKLPSFRSFRLSSLIPANEIAVEAFVNHKITFPQITEAVRATMDAHSVVTHPTLEQILEADAWARHQGTFE